MTDYRSDIKVGDRFKIGETEFEVTSAEGVEENSTTEVKCQAAGRDYGSYIHYLYLGSVTAQKALHVEWLPRPEVFEQASAYIDADGDVFLRNNLNGSYAWVGFDGRTRHETYPTRPLRKPT